MASAEIRNKIFDTPSVNYLNHEKGWKSWAFTLDHKRIGIMYLIGVTAALLLAGVSVSYTHLTLPTIYSV